MQTARAAELLVNARHAVILTGAGISTPSGIPDFRSTDNGLWQKYNPLEVASLTAFRVNTNHFFEWFRPLTKQIVDANPNIAHYAVSELEKEGIIKTVITQNIDNLHQKAGSKNVFEIHGTLNTMTCVSCYTQYPSSQFLDSYLETGEIPICTRCHNTLKPDAILFEEQLPKKVWKRIVQEINKSDLMMVIGSSLEVIPVANLPYQIISNGGRLIIINNEPTYIDSRADVVLHEDVVTALPAILDKINI
jgi:NAD-dependent deacetylase